MAYVRKTETEYVLFADYGHGEGWEEETVEKTPADIQRCIKEYRSNAPQYKYKWRSRRVKIAN